MIRRLFEIIEWIPFGISFILYVIVSLFGVITSPFWVVVYILTSFNYMSFVNIMENWPVDIYYNWEVKYK